MVQKLTTFLDNKRNKKIIKIVFYSLISILYFSLALTFIYKLGSFKQMNILFGSDNGRVFNDWVHYNSNNYRTKVHPLYVLIIYPIVGILRFIVKDPAVAVAIFISISAVLTIFILEKILTKLSKATLFINIVKVVVITFFALSFTMCENIIIVESFLISALSVLIVWLVYLNLKDKLKNSKNLTILNYTALILSGVLVFAFLITNYFYFVLATALLFLFQKHKTKKEFLINVLKFVIVNLATLLASLILCYIQKFIFPSSENAFLYVLKVAKDFILGTKTSEDVSYISSVDEIGFNSLFNLITASFIFSFFGYKTNFDIGYNFNHVSILNYIYLSVFVVLFIYSVILIFKNKKILLALPFAVSLCFEYVLHIFYGNSELMLYSIQMALPIIIIMFIGLSSEEKPLSILLASGVLVFLTLVDIVFNTITFVEIGNFLNVQYFIEYSMPALIFLLILLEVVVAMAIVVLVKFIIRVANKGNKNDFDDKSKNAKWIYRSSRRIIAILAIFIFFVQIGAQLGFAGINNKVVKEREERYVATIGEEDSIYKVNMTMVFGMGLRQKFVVEKAGRYRGEAVLYKYDPSTGDKETIYDNLTVLEYDSVNYVAKLKQETNGKTLTIYENEDGVYLKTDENIQTLDDSQKINIPSFEEFEYSQHMRALFGELMVNITKDGFVPNIFYYKNTSWYRDGSLACLVLEKTNNLSQVEEYIESLDADDIYDKAREVHSNIPGIREQDNLGQLLYLLSLVENPNEELIKAVITEVKRITKVNSAGQKYIEGITDFSILPVYQTKYLIWGMNKLIDSLGDRADSIIGDFDINEYGIEGMCDNYTDLCWFFNNSSPDKFAENVQEVESDLWSIQSKDIFPYLNWARLHYYQIKINVWDLKYPLTRENHTNSTEFCITHMWSAAEMLLYLYDYESFE